jgi:hypothetical protein
MNEKMSERGCKIIHNSFDYFHLTALNYDIHITNATKFHGDKWFLWLDNWINNYYLRYLQNAFVISLHTFRSRCLGFIFLLISFFSAKWEVKLHKIHLRAFMRKNIIIINIICDFEATQKICEGMILIIIHWQKVKFSIQLSQISSFFM